MNKENAKDYLPLVQALAEGKVIQCIAGSGWKDVGEPSFASPPTAYRIKPEPREIWVNKYGNCLGDTIHYSRAAAEKSAGPNANQVCYREVIE